MEESEAFIEPSSKVRRLEEKRKKQEKPPCLYGSSCFRRSPAHLEAYSHPKKDNLNLPNLPPCKYGAQCYDRNLLHFAMYYHPIADSAVDQSSKTYNFERDAIQRNDKNRNPKEDGLVDECLLEECQDGRNPVLTRGPSILRTYSVLTEEQKKDLIRKALEAKQYLMKKLDDTEKVLSTKNEELDMLRLKLDKSSLKVDGEEEALKGDEIKYFLLCPERKFREDSASDIHFRLAESQFYRLLPTGSPYKVTKVQYVVQPFLIKRFNEARKQMKEIRGEDNSYPVLGFHGTKENNIESICQTGFRVPGEEGFRHASDPGWYGKGVYFSEYPRYSMNYIRDSSKLLLCQVLPGKVYRCKHIIQGQSLLPGFDSHMSPDGKEVVVFNSHHILPSYIVHYSAIHGDFYYEQNE